MVSLTIGTNHIPDVRLAIFDKDGTLIELHKYWSKVSWKRAETIAGKFHLGDDDIRNLVSAMGVDPATNLLKQSGPVGVRKREFVMQAAEDYLVAAGHADPHEACYAAFEEVDRMTIKMFDELVHPIPGTGRLLKDLHESGCKVAIATSDRTARAELAIQHLNLLQYIDLIVGADRINVPKPDPETVTYILDTLHGDLQSTVVIGDTDVDMELGIRSGVKACIGVCSGTVPCEDLRKKTPYVIENVGHISVDPS